MKKLRKKTDFRENAGKVFIDFGKLVFGSMFLGGVLRGELPPVIMVTVGFSVSIFFCGIGLFLTAKEKQENKGGNL